MKRISIVDEFTVALAAKAELDRLSYSVRKILRSRLAIETANLMHKWPVHGKKLVDISGGRRR